MNSLAASSQGAAAPSNSFASPDLTSKTSATAPTTPSKAALTKDKIQQQKPSGLSRVFNPPKLERKHSSGDLISRLKTRKILGVGETDNGDIHRSKISQVLGHNEHLYVRLPRGYWATHIFLGVEVTLEALVLLFAPAFASYVGIVPPNVTEETSSTSAVRIAGAALSGLVVFMWSLLGTTDKHYARTVLAAIFTYHALCFTLFVGAALNHEGGFSQRWIRLSGASRAALCLMCIAYFHSIASFVPIRGNRLAYGGRQGGQLSKEY